MLNFKSNKKGEVATLLTLGLVLVGTLITLGTSLFVNETKNIASNPRAGGGYTCCQVESNISSCPAQKKFTLMTIGISSCASPLIDCLEYFPSGEIGDYKCVSDSASIPTSKCGTNEKYDCSEVLGYNNRCKDKKGLEFGCWEKSSELFYGCIGTPCSEITGVTLITEKELTGLKNASGYVPQCSGGAYVAQKDCETTCGKGNCQECKLGSYTTKYECKVSTTGKLKQCGPETFWSVPNCQNKYGKTAKCTQCLIGISVAYEYNGSGPTMGTYVSEEDKTQFNNWCGGISGKICPGYWLDAENFSGCYNPVSEYIQIKDKNLGKIVNSFQDNSKTIETTAGGYGYYDSVCCADSCLSNINNTNNKIDIKCSDGKPADCLFYKYPDAKGPALCTKGKVEDQVNGCSFPRFTQCKDYTDIHKCSYWERNGKGCAWDSSNNVCKDKSIPMGGQPAPKVPIVSLECKPVACSLIPIVFNPTYPDKKAAIKSSGPGSPFYYAAESCGEIPSLEDELQTYCNTPPSGQIIPKKFIEEGRCNASGSIIKFGNCEYWEKSGQQPCSSSTPLTDAPDGCTIFRICFNQGGCRYDCYEGNQKKGCSGVFEPKGYYDYIRIVNTSSDVIQTGKVVVEKMRSGKNTIQDLDQSLSLQPGEMKSYDLNNIGFTCDSISLNSIKVHIFRPNSTTEQMAQGSDDCGGGVKILINLK